VPAILHGDGNPEGIVFAPQGSAFMRRDNSGIGNAIYAKTTGATLATGWQAVNVGNAELASSSLPVGPVDGQVQRLRLGSSPYEFIRMVYDSTYGHWVGGAEILLQSVSSSSANTGNVWMNIGVGAVIPYKALTDAALTLQVRISGVCHNPSAGTLDLGVQLTPYAVNGGAGTASTDSALVTTTSTSDVMLDSGWVTAPAITANTLAKVYARLRDSVTNNNVADSVTIWGRWIG